MWQAGLDSNHTIIEMHAIHYVLIAFSAVVLTAAAVIAYKASKQPNKGRPACGTTACLHDGEPGGFRMIGGVDLTDLNSPDIR